MTYHPWHRGLRLVGAAASAAVLLGLAACSPVGGTAGSAADAPDEPVRGGTLVVGDTNNNWTTLDPHVTNTNVGPYKALYEALFRYGSDGNGGWEVQPALATAWNLEDPIHPVIDLRDGVTFHDGSPLTAEVVAWNIERMVNDDDSNARTTLTDVTSVDTLDDDTVQLTLAQPSASIFVRLSDSAGVGRSIVSKQAFDQNGAEWFEKNEAGTGPFSLDTFAQDQNTKVVAYDDYWAEGEDGEKLPYLDAIDFQILRDSGAAMSGLTAGTIDIVGDPSTTMLSSAKNSSSIRIAELTSQDGYPGTFGFNYTKAPFDNKLVRQAAQMAMDRETLVKVVNPDYAEPAEVPQWNDSMPGWSDELDHLYDYDVAGATKLMDKAGISDVKATLIYQSREPDASIAQLWKQQFAAIGIDLTTEPLEETVFESRLVSGDFDMATWGWGTPLTADFANVYWSPGGAQNWVSYDNSALNDLLQQASTSVGDAQRDALYGQSLETLMDDAVYGVILRQTPLVLTRTAVGGTTEFWGSLDYNTAFKTN